jgi:hypothetical protein
MPDIDIRFTAFVQQGWKILLSVVERYVWRNEAKSLSGINLDEVANPPAKHRANKDVRVQNNHLTSRRLSTPAHLFELS